MMYNWTVQKLRWSRRESQRRSRRMGERCGSLEEYGVRYGWIDEYLLQKRSVTKDFQPDWNWIRYHIGGKMFAAICLDDGGRPVLITLKLDPAEGEFLRAQYADILPGYYMDKRCWNSVKPDGQVPDALLKTLLDKSYRLVLRGFSKARQREILGISPCGAECEACPLHGATCAGCNALRGKVFHAPEGKACPLFACPVQKHRYATCGECPLLPCDIWRATRDLNLTDEAFEESVTLRVQRLRGNGEAR